MKFPRKIKFRGVVRATIYGKSASYPFFRVAATVAGKRKLTSHQTYADALATAEKLAREIAAGLASAAFNPKQADDAATAMRRLDVFRAETGRRLSLAEAVAGYCTAVAKLGTTSLGEAVDGYLRTVASVKRKDIGEAVEEVIALDATRTKSKSGERPEMSSKWGYIKAIILRQFAATFPGSALVDLSKDHLDLFMGSAALAESSAKTRNHRRAILRQFFAWASRKEYLSRDHRLEEADAMRPERANTAEIECYTAPELRRMLETADDTMRPMLAIGGLAGLRTAELLRLDWRDVWRVPGHLEVTAQKAKTRARRLPEIMPALAAWLEPYRKTHPEGLLWNETEAAFHSRLRELRKAAKVAAKRNGLRHAFCSFAYLVKGEDWTAKAAGHAPTMLITHYRGLHTEAEAKAWFAVKPPAEPGNVVRLERSAS